MINNNVKIGKNCFIKSHAIIGEAGFGIEKDEHGNNYPIAHIGSVIIKDQVEIGAFNTVASGTIEPTVIEDYLKCDDHVHIAHNCHIGRNTTITACTMLSGSVTIEEDVWIGPNSAVIQGITLDKQSLLGIESVVISNTNPNMVYTARPARKLHERYKT